uniref:hypothetical protein n=1 Tax=Helicobacter rodentium TaxID=59617 RepID=UPI00054FE70A
PIIVDNTIKAIQYMVDNNIDFLSPQFFRVNQFFRGKANNVPLLPQEYARGSFYTSGIIFDIFFLKQFQDVIGKHTPRYQVYPEIIFAIIATVFGKASWFNLPTTYFSCRMPTFSHDDTEEGNYGCLIERWRQFQRFMSLYSELLQMPIQDRFKENINMAMQSSASQVFFGLKNSAKAEFPSLKEYF